MLKCLLHERTLDEPEAQRATRLIQLAQQQRDFSRAIRITLDEAVIQDIINRPHVPELICRTPPPPREWQVRRKTHAGQNHAQNVENPTAEPTPTHTPLRTNQQKDHT